MEATASMPTKKEEDDLAKQLEKMTLKEQEVKPEVKEQPREQPKAQVKTLIFVEITELTEDIVKDVTKLVQFLKKNKPPSVLSFTIEHEQKSEQWLQERSIRLTGSNFKKFARSRPETRLKMAYENLSGENKFFTNKAMEYGNQNEHHARDYYQALHPELKIQESTLTIRTSAPWLGASPDGLVLDQQGKLLGAIQVKCPYSKKDMKLDEVIDGPSDFYLKRKNGQIYLDPNHDYYYQIQGQMFVLDIPWVDFVVRTEKDIKIVRMPRNQQFIEQLCRELKKLYFQNYVWEVLKHYLRPSYLKQDTIYFMKGEAASKLMSMF